MYVQSILVPKSLYTRAAAIKWVKIHGFHHKKIDATSNYYRFRQLEPKEDAKYFTKALAGGISAVVGY